jgi:hypothetical protein
MEQEAALVFAKRFDDKLHMTKEAIDITGTKNKVYESLEVLKDLGAVRQTRGSFMINTAIAYQSMKLIRELLPSLKALKMARRFGKRYSDLDVNFAISNIDYKLITLDYKAWELTNYQTPSTLYLYVKDVEQTAVYLKQSGFKEGRSGRVVILPSEGDIITNQIQRVYFDCISKGGRSLLDAIAIELIHGDKLELKGQFTIEDVKNVQANLSIASIKR